MIEIMRAKEDHVADIGRLWLEFMHFHQDIDPIFEPQEGSVPGFEDEIRRQMISEDGLVLVAIDHGKPVGFSLSEIRDRAKVYKAGRYGVIDTMAVTAHYRHGGISEKMVGETLSWFQSKGIERVELEVLVANQVGYSFWKKQGFTAYRHRLFRQI
jgi:ribosomal protein S18 acetylase RimI-like enzyme